MRATGSTGGSSAATLPTGPEDIFGNEVLSSATAGEVDVVAHSATLLAAEDSIIKEEKSTKEAGQNAFKMIEKDENLLQNLTSRYQMALKDKLHALRDLEYSKTRGDDEAMANEKEDIETDSKKMKLFQVEISDAKKHLAKAKKEALRYARIYNALKKTDASKLADMKAVLLASRRVRLARKALLEAERRVHEATAEKKREETVVENQTTSLQSKRVEMADAEVAESTAEDDVKAAHKVLKKTSSTLEIARDEEADETESLTHAKNNEAEADRLLNSAYQANYENRFNIQEHLGDSATGATGATGVADAERIVMEADSEYLEQSC